jgi:hypothetical protein
MPTRIKTYSGAIVLLSGLPAWAQSGTQTGTSSSAASAPTGSNSTVIGDPGWFVAGLVTGLVVGAIGAKVFGSSKSTDG